MTDTILTSYTPGPWHFDGHGINSEEGERIAKVSHGERYDYSSGNPIPNRRFAADSLLIAAAPSLLSALQHVLEVVDQELHPDSPTRIEALAAIEHAKTG